jgi:hypothetical protein
MSIASRHAPSGKNRSDELSPDTAAFYRRSLEVLTGSGVPFLLGGAYALAQYTGVVRHTKDLDVFVTAGDCDSALKALADAGYVTKLTFPHWLGKAFSGDHLVDLIFSSGNGLCRVDEQWFRHADAVEFLGMPIRLVPVEELIWSKGFVQERERFDGADIAHLLRARGARLDWQRLVCRFGRHWRVLLAHLVLFGYIYPTERAAVPDWVLEGLWRHLFREMGNSPPSEPICQGTFLSREQYLADIQHWGYADPRLAPDGPLSQDELEHWTWAINNIP